MSTWLDEYRRKLATTLASKRGGLTRPGMSVSDISLQMAQNYVPRQSSGSAKASRNSGGNFWQELWDIPFNPVRNTLTIGQKVLDALGTTNYGVANMATEAAERGEESGIFNLAQAIINPTKAPELLARAYGETQGADMLTNPVEDIGAFWRGVSHQKHTTFDDYLEAKGRPAGLMRGLEGFLMDVTFDPLSYVGATAMNKVGRGAMKIPGVAPTVAKARNLGRAKGKTTPINLDEYPIKAEVEETLPPLETLPPPVGTPYDRRPDFVGAGTGGSWDNLVPEQSRDFLESLADISTRSELGPLANESGLLALPPGPTVAREGMGAVGGPSARPFVAGERGIESPNFDARELADIATYSEIQRLLSAVPTRRKAPDDDLFFDVRILDPKEPFKVTEKIVGTELVSKADPKGEVLKELAGRALRDMMANPQTRGRTILKAPKGYKGPTKNGKVSFADAGKWAAGNPERIEALNASFAEAASRMAKKPSALRKEQIRIFEGPVPKTVTVKEMEEMLTGNVPVERLQRTALPGGGGKRIPLAKYRQSIQAQMRALRADPTMQELRNVVEKVETENWIPVRRRYPKGSKQLATWRRHMEEAGFTRQEINALNRNANLSEAAYRALFQKIVDKKIAQKYDLDSLEAAIKDKRVDAEDIKPLLDLLGVKTLRGARTRIDKIQARIKAISEGSAPAMERGGLFDELDARRAKPGTPEYDVRNARGETVTNPSAADFVDTALAVGDDLSAPVGKVSRQEAEAISDTLAQFNSGLQKKVREWRFKTNRGALRNSPTPGEGQATFIHGYNAKDQYTVANKLMRNLSEQYTPKVWNSMGPEQRVNIFLNSLKTTEDTLKARGFFPILGHGDKGTPLSLHDILSNLPPAIVNQHVLSFPTAQATENWLDFAKAMLDDIEDMAKPSSKVLRDLENIALKPMVRYQKWDKKSKRMVKLDKPETIQSNFAKAAAKSGNKRQYAQERMVQPMLKIAGKLDMVRKKNMAEYVIGESKAVRQATDEIIAKFNEDITSGAIASAIHRMSKIGRETTDTLKKNDVEGFAAAPLRTEEQVKVEIESIADGSMLHVAGKAAQGYAKAGNKAEIAKVTGAQTKAVAQSDREIIRNAIIEGDLTDFNLQQELEFGLVSRFARHLGPHIGNKELRPWLIGERNAAQAIAMRYTAGLNKLSKMYTTEQLAEAFRYIQNPSLATNLSPETLQVVESLRGPTNMLFSEDLADDAFSFFKREGFTIDQVNRMLAHNGLSEKFRFRQSLDDWREWDLDDPLDALSRLQATAQHLSALKTVGAKFTEHFGHDTPIIGRKMVRIKKGHGRTLKSNIRGSEHQDSWLFDFIDDSKFYDREIAEQLSVLDKAVTEMYIPASRGKFMRAYDTLLHSTKAGYTIYRVGHHIRNAVGDAWLNWMIGVRPKDYVKGTKALAVSRGMYRDMDFTKWLANMGENPVVRGDEVLVRKTLPGGRTVELTAAQINKGMFRKGALPDHNIIEDTGFNSPLSGLSAELGIPTNNKVIQTLVRPTGGRVRKAATSFSEVRDHMFRAPQFIRELEKLTPRTHFPNGKKMTDEQILDDLFDRAASATRKHHPDGSDLTTFERQAARRMFTFYSWARKAIPLVLEHILMRPGRFMVYPKAMYNIAEGQGIDLNGYGDPFPSDQLFPDFITESVQGPIAKVGGSYIGVKPGTPGVDILDEYFGTPYESLLNAVVPFVRVPFELGTGHKAGGVPIMDKSDYIGQQIPGMGYADRAANTLFGVTVSSGFQDPLYTAKSNEGYEDPLTAIGLLNWLGGMGVTDMSKPSFRKAAEYDMRDRMRKAAGG